MVIIFYLYTCFVSTSNSLDIHIRFLELIRKLLIAQKVRSYRQLRKVSDQRLHIASSNVLEEPCKIAFHPINLINVAFGCVSARLSTIAVSAWEIPFMWLALLSLLLIPIRTPTHTHVNTKTHHHTQTHNHTQWFFLCWRLSSLGPSRGEGGLFWP